MKDCFNTHIGLKGCGKEPPTSGMFINDVQGMSTELAENIANSDQVTASGVWSSVLKTSKLNLINDLTNGLSEKINFHQIAYQTKRPRPAREKEVIPAFAEYRGVLIEAPESRYSQIRIKSLFVYSSALVKVTVTLKVWNVWDGSEISSKQIEIAPGLNELPINAEINLTYSENSVFIGLDSSLLPAVYFLPEGAEFWDFWDDECPISNLSAGQSLRIGPALLPLAGTPGYNTIRRMIKPMGVWAHAEIICSAELFLCENIHHFTAAITYLQAWQLLLFKIASPRTNFFTYHREDVTEKLMSEFKSQYESNLKRTLAAIPVSGSGFCFDCSDTRMYEIQGSMP